MNRTPWHLMSPADREAFAIARARAERVAQGLPERVEDPVVLDRLATLLTPVTVPTEAAA